MGGAAEDGREVVRCAMASEKRDQLIIADELVGMAQWCLKRLHDSSYGAFGNQTKNQLAKVDVAMSELRRLVSNALEKSSKKGD